MIISKLEKNKFNVNAMKVIFLKDYANKKKGEKNELTDWVAKELIAKKIVEQVSMSKKVTKTKK